MDASNNQIALAYNIVYMCMIERSRKQIIIKKQNCSAKNSL